MTPTTRCLDVRRLIYVSRSLIDADAAVIDAMVERSSVRNAAAGITGMLWFDGANFAQVLEGEHDRVGETMARITTDVRHTDVEIVLDRVAQGRAFGEWGMIQPDDGPKSTRITAFLIGLSMTQPSRAARRLHDIIMSCDI